MTNTGRGILHNRKERIFCLYKVYLLGKTVNDQNEDLNFSEYNFSEDQLNFIKNIISSTDDLENEILKHLPSDWKWERFNNIEKAIILNATAEILLMNNKKAITIDESVKFAKKYCGEKSEPLINAIIDKIEI